MVNAKELYLSNKQDSQLTRRRRIFIMYKPILVIKCRERDDVLSVIFELICYLCTYYRLLTMDDKNQRTIPKHIVFLSQLLLLFRFCHSCKADSPLVETRKVGSKAVVTTTCSNPKCPQKTTTWHSQPMVPGTKISGGNFLICMATLLSGGSFSKVMQIFLNMGLGCVSLSTYFRYQRVCTYCIS